MQKLLRCLPLIVLLLFFIGVAFFAQVRSAAESEPAEGYSILFSPQVRGDTIRIDAKSLRIIDDTGAVRRDLSIKGTPEVFLVQNGEARKLGRFKFG